MVKLSNVPNEFQNYARQHHVAKEWLHEPAGLACQQCRLEHQVNAGRVGGLFSELYDLSCPILANHQTALKHPARILATVAKR